MVSVHIFQYEISKKNAWIWSFFKHFVYLDYLYQYVWLTLQRERSGFLCEIQFRFLERFEDLCTWFYELRFLMIWKRGVNKKWYSHKIQLSFIYLPKLINTALLMWYEVKFWINKSVCKPKVKEHDFLT